MAKQSSPSGDAIRIRLAKLAERSRIRKRPAPEPLVRTRLGAQTVAEAQPVPLGPPAQPLGPKRRGPQKAPTKVQISIRLDPDVLDALKSGGKGWQSRLNAALRELLDLECLAADQPVADPHRDDRADGRDECEGKEGRMAFGVEGEQQERPERRAKDTGNHAPQGTVVPIHQFFRNQTGDHRRH